MPTVLRPRRIVNSGIHKKRRNVGQIITLGLMGNPGNRKRKRKVNKAKKNSMAIITFNTKGKRKRNMATKKRRTNTKRRVTAHRRRTNSGSYKARRRRNTYASHRRRANSGTRKRRNYTRRRRNGVFSMITRRRRRRNAGVIGSATGGITQALSVVGGAILCNAISGYLPASLNSGPMSYIATAAIAMAQGAIASKVLKNPTLGKNLQLGGFVIVALRIVKDFMPSLGNPFAGMGILAPTSFYNPQVPIPNSMNQFQVPAAVMSALPAPQSNSMGRVMRSARVGRM